VACSRLSGRIQPRVCLFHAWKASSNGHGIKLVRPLSTVDNTRGYARVSHSRQWSKSKFPLQCSSDFQSLGHLYNVIVCTIVWTIWLVITFLTLTNYSTLTNP